MKKNKLAILLLCCAAAVKIQAQTCTGLGQNPGSAFPVCGTSTFTQGSVPVCGGRDVPGPCSSSGVSDINPYWYKFTCFATGTLSFTITPVNGDDDYDWQLFDVTNRDPVDIYTDASLFVASNWSGEPGNTGTNTTAVSLTNCGGFGVPLFSKMPTLVTGHQYILLISHFSGDSQSGYTLKFDGGTANITDPVAPRLLGARAACDGTKIAVKLNKKMKCSSLNADGSDFILLPAIAPVTAAAGIGCSGNFDLDSVVLTLGSPLPPGNYKITVRPNNNLLDNCDNFIPLSDTLDVTVFPLVATPMDSIGRIKCAPDSLQLVFRDLIRCSSIAADGSDFLVTGSSAVTVSGAGGSCNADGLTSTIQVKLSVPIQVAGSFTIQLKPGSDGNTIINECGKETSAGASLPFTTKDTVSALFSTTIQYNCNVDNVQYLHDGRNGVNNWQWTFDNTITSTAKDTLISYAVFGEKQAVLIVSNGTCSDTTTAIINLKNGIQAAFENTAAVCPGDGATFKNNTTSGFSFTSLWNFGNGITSGSQDPPPQFYTLVSTTKDIPVQLIVTDSIGCSDTAINIIKVVNNCTIAVPKAFSPNGDGLNDYLYPTNAYKSKDLIFRVFNRGGQKIFETRNWQNKWDGTLNGNAQDPGTYVWILQYTNIETAKRTELKGTTVLIR